MRAARPACGGFLKARPLRAYRTSLADGPRRPVGRAEWWLAPGLGYSAVRSQRQTLSSTLADGDYRGVPDDGHASGEPTVASRSNEVHSRRPPRRAPSATGHCPARRTASAVVTHSSAGRRVNAARPRGEWVGCARWIVIEGDVWPPARQDTELQAHWCAPSDVAGRTAAAAHVFQSPSLNNLEGAGCGAGRRCPFRCSQSWRRDRVFRPRPLVDEAPRDSDEIASPSGIVSTDSDGQSGSRVGPVQRVAQRGLDSPQ